MAGAQQIATNHEESGRIRYVNEGSYKHVLLSQFETKWQSHCTCFYSFCDHTYHTIPYPICIDFYLKTKYSIVVPPQPPTCYPGGLPSYPKPYPPPGGHHVPQPPPPPPPFRPYPGLPGHHRHHHNPNHVPHRPHWAHPSKLPIPARLVPKRFFIIK